ncbi:MAG: hypothetical protein AB4911_22345 [Oscillochloridaceae bacterium umkhey_bin13]
MIREEPVAPVVLVLPADRAETLIERILQTGAARVQLLVPDGIIALQQADEAARLSALATAAGVELLLISADPVTLEVARRRGIPTVGLRDARVAVPAPRPAPSAPAQPIRPAPAAAAPPPAKSALAAAPPAAEATTHRLPPSRPDPERDFLAALDELDVAPPPQRTIPPADELAAAQASLDAALKAPPPSRSDDELLAAVLDREPGLTPPRTLRPAPAPTRPLPTPRPEPRPQPAPRPVARPQPAPAPPRSAPRPAEAVRAPLPARRNWPIFALAATLIVLLALIGGLLLWGSRVTVVVLPPNRPETIEIITDLPVPLAPQGSDPATAVIAEPIQVDVSFASVGQVTEGTLTPAGTASGSVTILNSTPQAILIPAGSEFLAFAADGRQVPFVSGADTLVPGATTSDTGAQIVTSRGQATLAVVARSPGSGSNVDGNTVRRITPPGGAGFNVDGGSVLVQHGPLTGGTEEEVRIVKDSDVQALLAPTLEGLDATGRSRLSELAAARSMVLDAGTVMPKRSELEQLQGFEALVQPSIGQTLDPTSPNFSLTALARYSGLAIPPDRPINAQLGAALTEQLRQAGRLVPGDCRAPAVTGWRWDGERLLVSGEIRPDSTSPGCDGGLDQATLEQVREAVRGQSREQAAINLDALVAANLIGGYTLPPVEQLPRWDWQIQLDS